MLVLWIASLAAATGACLTVIGTLSASVLIAVLDIGLIVCPVLAWVLWALALVLLRPGEKTVSSALPSRAIMI